MKYLTRILKGMEQQINTDNVAYIDEYPELQKRVWLRRLAQERALGVITLPRVIPFPIVK